MTEASVAEAAPEAAGPRGAVARAAGRIAGWWFPAVPERRAAVLRTVVYLFLFYDVLVLVDDVVPHAYGPESFYRPLRIPRLLHLPAPTPVYAHTLRAVILGGALVAATGRLPRLAGWAVAVAYLDWIFIGYSYGKVDHDHLALLVALFVLPLAGTGRDGRRSEATGWALRCIQVAAICTYFLSAWAKMRRGGWGWANSATFYWAVSRRGTALGDHLLGVPWLLHAGQWVVLVMEFLSPVILFVKGRARLIGISCLLGFHLVTYLSIKIHFLPTVVCLLAFAPLERLRLPSRARRAVPAPGPG